MIIPRRTSPAPRPRMAPGESRGPSSVALPAGLLWTIRQDRCAAAAALPDKGSNADVHASAPYVQGVEEQSGGVRQPNALTTEGLNATNLRKGRRATPGCNTLHGERSQEVHASLHK